MTYFCVDCEASGPLPPFYNLLSIGATVVFPEGDHHRLGPSFYVELKPVFPGFDAKALEVCGLDVERLSREGLEPAEAMGKFKAWVEAHNASSRDWPVFVGHNAVFDWAYIAYYFAYCKLENPFGYKAIDSKSLAMGRLRIGWNETSKEVLERLLDLPPQDPVRAHRADYDAWYQASLLCALLDR